MTINLCYNYCGDIMNINEIYNRVLQNNYSKEELNWLLNYINLNQLTQETFLVYYKILKKLENNNELDFINKFISICQKETSNKNQDRYFKIFRLAFDKKFPTKSNVDELIKLASSSILLKLKPILIKELKSYIDLLTYKRLITIYYEFQIQEYYNETPIEDIIKNMDFSFFADIDDKYFLTNQIDELDFWDNELFKIKIQEIFKKNPNKLIECGNIDYHYFEFIRKNVIHNGKPIDELIKYDTILINECDYANGWDKSQTAMIKLYDYYYSKNQINEIKNLITPYFGGDSSKLYSKPGYEQFITHIIKTNCPIEVCINQAVIDKYYNKLLELKTNNIFVVFEKDNFGSGKEIISFSKYQKARRFYDKLSEEIKKYNFTPLEAYLYSYIKTRSFKSYKFYKDDKKQDDKYPQMSRNPFFIIDNDCIVCAGYSNFMLELLKRLNISASYLRIGREEAGAPHAQVLVHLKDDSYNINGVYIGEVTGSKNAINEKYSCFDAVGTKDKKSYTKYQIGEKTRSDFLYAMEQLDIEDKYKSDTNPEFFDIINRNIPPKTIVNAVLNIIKKTKPHLSQDDIIEEATPYCLYRGVSLLPPPNRHLKKQFKDLETELYDIYMHLNFNSFIDNPYINFHNSVAWHIGGKPYNKIRYHILIEDKNKNAEETANILLSNKILFENQYIKFYYDEEYKSPGIQLLIPENFAIEMLRDIFVNATYSINEILGYGINRDSTLITSHHKGK